RQLLVSRLVDAAQELVSYDIATGRERVARIPPGVIGLADWVDEDRIAYSHNTSATRVGLFLHDLASGKTEALVAPEYGAIDPEDIEGAVRYLRSLPHVDGERIGIMGGSYGGFMSFIAAAKKAHLWKAAVPSYGVTDLHAMWAESKQHFRHFLRTQMGDPEADRALWRDRSAVEFADQVTAKLLI